MKVLNSKLLLLLFALAGTQHLSQAQTHIWSKQLSGSENESGNAVAIDNLSNVVTVGYFEGGVDFDPGEGNAVLTSVGQNDAFISKLDADGNYIWATQFGSSLSDFANDLTIDDSNNILTVGSFQGAFQVQTFSGSVDIASNGSWDIFISKYDAEGNLIWIKTIGGNDIDQAFEIETDLDGNIFITGFIDGQVDLDPGPGEFLVNIAPGSNSTDIFVLKLNPNGEFVWGNAFGNWSLDEGHALAVDISGSVILTGAFRETVDFDPGDDTFELTSIDDFDTFILKLDENGNFEWAKSLSSQNNNRGFDVAVDNNGNICVVGYFNTTTDFDPGSGIFELTAIGLSDIYVLKLSPDGNLIWVKQISGPNQEQAYSVVTDNANNIYLTGWITGVVDADPGPDNYTIGSDGGNIIIEKLDEDGVFIWAHGLGAGGAGIGYGLAVTEDQELYCTGYFLSLVDFNPNSWEANFLYSQHNDVFILKWGTEINTINPRTLEVNPIALFPNPSKGHFRLSLAGLPYSSTAVQISVYNATGQLVLSTISAIHSPEMDLSAYPGGIYTVKVVHASGVYSAKLILE